MGTASPVPPLRERREEDAFRTDREARSRPHGRGVLDELADAIEHRSALVIAVAATVLEAFLYMVPNQAPLFRPRELPLWPIDRAVPFLPWTVWIYFTDYLLVFAGFVLCRAPGGRLRFAYGFFATLLVATGLHWLLPIAYPRELFPIPPGTDALARWGLSTLRALDSPLSCFPSLHVAIAVYAALAGRTAAKRASWVLFAWAALITLSTLTTRQHYAVDLLGGIALGTLAWSLAFNPRRAAAPSVGG